MDRERNWARGTLEYCTAILLVAVGLPIIAALALLLRGVLVFVAIAAIFVGVILYCAHPGCRRWLSEPATATPAGNHPTRDGRVAGRD